MADSKNSRTVRALRHTLLTGGHIAPPAAIPNDDPALAVCALWHVNCDRLEEAAALASQREQVLFDTDESDPGWAEIERQSLAAERVHDWIGEELETLGDAIFKFQARTFEGVAAKLVVALRSEAPSLDDPDRPWPYFRSVLNDLTRLVAASSSS
jgi:hypothetical protein